MKKESLHDLDFEIKQKIEDNDLNNTNVIELIKATPITNNESIFTALLAVKAEIAPFKKNKSNKFLNYDYADYESILKTCNPIFLKYKIIHYTYKDVLYPRTLNIVLYHVPSNTQIMTQEELIVEKYEKVNKTDTTLSLVTTMQGSGSAQTYASRYGLLGLLGMVPEADDDAATLSNNEANQKQIATKTKFIIDDPIIEEIKNLYALKMDAAIKDKPMTAADIDRRIQSNQWNTDKTVLLKIKNWLELL